jgi:hypothetical protein
MAGPPPEAKLRRVLPYQPHVSRGDVSPRRGAFLTEGHDHLVAFMVDAFQSLSADDQQGLVDYHRDSMPFGRIGTMCSGSDSIVHVEDAYRRALFRWRGVSFECEHVFAAEVDGRKREFLQRHFPKMQHLFKDVTELQGDTATCCMHGRVKTPSVSVLHKGFPCPDMSRLNQAARSGANSAAVRLAAGRTGGCFGAICEYYTKHISDSHFELGLSENVTALGDLKRQPYSNLDWCVYKYSLAGLWVKVFRICPKRDLGQPVARERLWFLELPQILFDGASEMF